MKYKETAERLSLALERANLTQQELADLSGVSKASISQYMNGSHAPSNFSSGKMAKVLRVDPVWLMGFGESQIATAFTSTSPSLVAKLMTDEQAKRLLEMFLELSEESRKSIYDLTEYLYHK